MVRGGVRRAREYSRERKEENTNMHVGGPREAAV